MSGKYDAYFAGAPGMALRGNIDLNNRPRVFHKNGSYSTVNSMSYRQTPNGLEVLIPTVSDYGTMMSPDEAIDQHMKTGRYLGMFWNPDDADRYAQTLHESQAEQYAPTMSMTPGAGSAAPFYRGRK